MSKRNRKVKSEYSVDPSFRLKKIIPLNDTQSDVFDAWYENFNLFLYGCAGTGKSYLALALALKEILNPNSPYHKVYIIRSAVPSRDMGFLPGRVDEKLSVYEEPYVKMLSDLFGRGDAFQILTQKKIVEILSTSFLRGTTLNNSIVVIEECQNMNYKEFRTVITRCGDNCRVIVTGDTEQDDLYKSKYDTSGMNRFMSVISKIDVFEMINFLPEDIVRGGICKAFILAELASNVYSATATNQQTYQIEPISSGSMNSE